MKPNWGQLIEAHTEQLTRADAEPGKLFKLKAGVVAISITTRSAGSARSPRGEGIPFLFHRVSTPEGTDRITLDLSHEDFLIFGKTETYTIAGQTQQFIHKHCIPWDNITEIEFIERTPMPR